MDVILTVCTLLHITSGWLTLVVLVATRPERLVQTKHTSYLYGSTFSLLGCVEVYKVADELLDFF